MEKEEIRIGLCTSADRAAETAGLGYDYIELPLNGLSALTDEEFEKLVSAVEASGIRAEACNCLFPGSIRVTGDGVSMDAVFSYLEKAFARAKRLHTQIVVFGSSRSRDVPPGFDTETAWIQILDMLKKADGCARKNGITIVIEPLCRHECNIIHYVSEAVLMASVLRAPNIRVLGDTYHMAMGSEPISALTAAGKLLSHVHIANPNGRILPARGDGVDYTAVFRALNAGGYRGRISCEAGFTDFGKDAAEAIRCLRAARSEAD